ncbi:D-ribose pyranase [Halalkalibacter hemicellulosilyticus]|uniref:D-ribose pyranase n=1 Tax=Halalkalibacter hemicellulosilyticusJCM 9152 TaxID=1236971 RepID=W4QGY6_9BACI|nr:D-ribose pyranase [Halalkalibacter hemicellulosilyticus]GAE31370.1 ribose ABC transport system [Halalkalibacter hemicellulosilyticusJCM 9152]
MKKQGILNRDISSVLAKLGHTDQIVIADCGLPIPEGVPCIDLSLELGDPTFLRTLNVVLADMEVEKGIVAKEIKLENTDICETIQQYEFPIDFVDHEVLKKQCRSAKAVIRTGEMTPYANIILQAGVIF